jgi:hypothetical protein
MYNSRPAKQHKYLDKLLERTVKRRAEGLDVLVEVNGELGALGNAFSSEFEFLSSALVFCLNVQTRVNLTL